ncbi:hypothetical protein V500_07629 [Pseudogymnoascus sp. VKM F-4518 (FW-2643)]|nr:hypothetical protein V500_07629 [Pseudogymnoascus sp. VKM F-4518 (FW-2643)]
MCAVAVAAPSSVAAPVLNVEVYVNDLNLHVPIEVALDGAEVKHSSRRRDKSEVEIELSLGSSLDSEVEIELGQGSGLDSEVEIELGLGSSLDTEIEIDS